MGKILRVYAIREIVLPTLMALLTIMFILMIRSVYLLIELVMQPGVSLFQVLRILISIMPNVLLLALPMAVLIGVLIGVGRMMLDREILVMRASGINIISVFAPALGGAFLLSAVIFWLSTGFVPARMQEAAVLTGQLKTAVVNSLDAGRFYKDFPQKDNVLYFRERSPENKLMGVVIQMNKDVDLTRVVSTETLLAQVQPGATPKPKLTKEEKEAIKKKKRSEPEDPFAIKKELTLIFAESGEISTQQGTLGEDKQIESELNITLRNGSMHQLAVEPGRRDYVVGHFDSMTRQMFQRDPISKEQQTLNNAGLKDRMQDDTLDEDEIAPFRKELWQRRSMWLATFVFVLVGIPLAIWVRPSGKSWGILIAIGLMLVYYIILQTGLSMIVEDKPLGVPVTLLPNALFAVLGGYLWWQTLRS